MSQSRAVAPRDDGQFNAHRLQHLDALPIQHRKPLQRLALGREIQAPIGEHAIHIQDHQPDGLSTQEKRGWKPSRSVLRHAQITFARMRSLEFSAPTKMP